MQDSGLLYEKLIYENIDKGTQYRLTVSEFREIQYLHVRKYFLSFEGDWVPTKEGAAIPCSLANMYALLDGLVEICAHEESIDVVSKHFSDRISELKSRSI